MKYTAERGWSSKIAVIGMAGRFPGAANLPAFWSNLVAGRDCISRFTLEELLAEGGDSQIAQDPAYIKARGIIDDADLFDAAFFGYSRAEANLMDPQQRVFLELAWEAMEAAGYCSANIPPATGVFAGTAASTYLAWNILPNNELIRSVGPLRIGIGNDSCYLAMRIAFKLGLRGPALTVGTACSTSLVAVHLACQSLLTMECDLALAGAVAIGAPRKAGYHSSTDGLTSPDGRCCAFDVHASGIVPGEGVGVVVLKRLNEAIHDGDHIEAVICGTAVNNDGASKMAFTAPAVDGQAQVIAAAIASAGIDPQSIGYIETHGTGTLVGDLIEISALKQVFGEVVGVGARCAIGSVKTNIGHAGEAAGMAGLLKTILMLKHRQIPPSLHCSEPNPELGLSDSPFFVNTALRDWACGEPRRAGVSAFGVGGTNAHVILEEAPNFETMESLPTAQLIVLSARTEAALNRLANSIAVTIENESDLNLANTAFTLQKGRSTMEQRCIVVASTCEEAVRGLQGKNPSQVFAAGTPAITPSLVFVFPGSGVQHPGMAAGLYSVYPVFRKAFNRCASFAEIAFDLDIREMVQAEMQSADAVAGNLALLAVEYALAQLWLALGLHPSAMLGYSLGEYTAACLANIMQPEDAMTLLYEFSRRVDELPPGAMLEARTSADRLAGLLPQGVEIAAINSPEHCAAAGPRSQIESLQRVLTSQQIPNGLTAAEHAFHATSVDRHVPILQACASGMHFEEPRIPVVSPSIGSWLTPQDAVDPRHWAGIVRNPVLFSNAIAQFDRNSPTTFLEVGPGCLLQGLISQQTRLHPSVLVLNSLPDPRSGKSDDVVFLSALGRLWMAGFSVDWSQLHGEVRRCRVCLPAYPFERERFWLDPPTTAQVAPKPRLNLDTGIPSETLHEEDQTIENVLLSVWQELFGVERVTRLDNFFDLGGDSLLAAQFTAKLKSLFPVKMPLKVFFREPTIEAVATWIHEQLIGQVLALSEERTAELLRDDSAANQGGAHGDGNTG